MAVIEYVDRYATAELSHASLMFSINVFVNYFSPGEIRKARLPQGLRVVLGEQPVETTTA
jgi:hypothetical protein